MKTTERANTPPFRRRSGRLAVLGGAMVVGGTITDSLAKDTMPASWRGDAGLWDVASHIANVPFSVTLVGAVALTTAALRKHLFTEVLIKKACATAAIAFAVGCGANAMAETSAILQTPIMQEYFSTAHADGFDQLYGDTAAAMAAGMLVASMRLRRPEEQTLGVAELPRRFDGKSG